MNAYQAQVIMKARREHHRLSRREIKFVSRLAACTLDAPINRKTSANLTLLGAKLGLTPPATGNTL